MELSLPCGRDVIETILPHRDPFVWLTRVTACNPGESCIAELEVDRDLPLFAGHFPTHPVLPGVILMEALAQAASFCLLVGRGDEGALGYLVGIDKARFRRQVRPGDVVVLNARIVKSTSRLCVAEVEALVDGALCAEATQRYVIAQNEVDANAEGRG